MTLSGVLMALAGPIAKQVFVSLGIGALTWVGIDAVLSSLLSQAQANYAGTMSAVVAAYLAMAGVNDALSVLAGALTTAISMVALKSYRLL